MVNIKLTTLDMEIALMQYLGIRQNIAVPNVSWGLLPYEADLVVLTKSNYATEIEIKVSKSDMVRDKKKNHEHDSAYFKYLYFAVPKELTEFALTIIPEKAGLLEVSKMDTRYWVRQARAPKRNLECVQWKAHERFKLAELGCMRILGLKKKVMKYKSELKTITNPPVVSRKKLKPRVSIKSCELHIGCKVGSYV